VDELVTIPAHRIEIFHSVRSAMGAVFPVMDLQTPYTLAPRASPMMALQDFK